MNHQTNNVLDPQAIAELLWHQFELRDGKALTLVLDQNNQQDNRQALLHWVRRRLAWHESEGISRPLLQLESELASLLIDSDLPGGELDVGAHRDDIDCAPGKTVRTQPSIQSVPRPSTSDTKIIPFPARSPS